jgi:hypothetical protein
VIPKGTPWPTTPERAAQTDAGSLGITEAFIASIYGGSQGPPS